VFDESGHRVEQPTPLEIQVAPGFKAGTKLTYEARGDQSQPGGPRGDSMLLLLLLLLLSLLLLLLLLLL
jgi:DnaJ-class molecular chaperone